jgi:hypothetical protein
VTKEVFSWAWMTATQQYSKVLMAELLNIPSLIKSMPVHHFADVEFSCWKVCGLWAHKNGHHSLSIQQQHNCCQSVHKFEVGLKMSYLVSTAHASSSTLSDIIPANHWEPDESLSKEVRAGELKLKTIDQLPSPLPTKVELQVRTLGSFFYYYYH